MPARSDFDRYIKDPNEPVVALVGTDTLLLRDAIDVLRAKTLTRAPDFNRDEMRAGETTIERVLDAARTMPMMAEKRWVHLSAIDKLKVEAQAAVLAYLEAPSPTTVLCLSGEKIDQRTKLGSRLAKDGRLFAFEPPRQNELAQWVARRAARHQTKIDPDAAQLLADLIGIELGSLDMALSKLAVYAGADTAITAEHVEQLVAPTRVHSIFELTDAIGARDAAKASGLLRNALDGGENGLMVLGMIARQFRQLIGVKEMLDEGARNNDLASELGIRPFLVDALKAQSRRYSKRELEEALLAVQRTDVKLKSSRLAHGVTLDRLLVDVMGGA
ncbi:MAG: DNA polymerase III subunit delta [Myxococcota bacterium]